MFKKLLYAGISRDISDLKAKANYFKNRTVIIVLLAAIFFIVQTYLNPSVEIHIKYKAYLFNGIPIILYFLALYISFKEKHLLSKLILLITVNLQIVAAALLVDTIFILYLLIVCLIPFTIFIVEKKLKYLFSILTILILISMQSYFLLYNIKPNISEFDLMVGFITFVTVAPIILVLIINDLQKTNIRIEQSLARERKKSDDLLLNILPEKTSEEIKAGKKVIADDFEKASILFADIVGFTDATSKVNASKVVNELNRVFIFIDSLIDEYKLEKIKTIGDAYMVAAGLPEKDHEHLEKIIDFALDLEKRVTELSFIGMPLKFKIGINTGPVVAGVLGKRKYIYDVWGETVNLASRLESHGVPGKIQITTPVYNKIKDKYYCEKRGDIYLKGIGVAETYFVIQRLA